MESLFAILGFSWTFCIAGFFLLNIYKTIPIFDISISIGSILALLGSILPGCFILIFIKTSRDALLRLDAGVHIYLIALAIGVGVPFTGYFGAADSNRLFTDTTISTFIRVFAFNIFLSPLWEEITWRGYLAQRLRTLTSEMNSVLLGSIGWSIWHLGFLLILFRGGLPLKLLVFLPFQYFFLGIILNCIFKKGNGVLLPCILLHACYNAGVTAYLGQFDRSLNMNSYISITVTLGVTSLAAFLLAERRIKQKSA